MHCFHCSIFAKNLPDGVQEDDIRKAFEVLFVDEN